MAARPHDSEQSALLVSFLDEVSAYLPQIAANLDRLQQVPNDLGAVEDAYRCTHTIAGSASLMNFPSLAQVARGMEETLGTVLDAKGSLPAPTLALLRRSYNRLSRLIDLIRDGKDDPALVAQDAADRSAWRGGMTGMQPAANAGGLNAGGLANSRPGNSPANSRPGNSTANGRNPNAAPPAPSAGDASVPIPDWLAAFGPSSQPSPGPQAPFAPGESWAAAFARSGANGGAPAAAAASPQNGAPSLDEMIGAFQASSSNAAHTGADEMAADTEVVPQWREAEREAGRSNAGASSVDHLPTQLTPATQISQAPTMPQLGGEPQAAQGVRAGGESQAVAALRSDAETARRQVAALREVIASVREAAQTMENERAELRRFLDGSQDALTRLEEWAGRQMGLDLAGSPESVRRFLPLSVIWVTTTRLQRIITQLNSAGRNLAISQEEIDASVGELRAAIEAVGALASGLTGGAGAGPFTWTPPAVRPDTGGARIVESVAPEGALGPGARAELERQVREELRRSLEAEVRDQVAADVRRDEEARLRHDLEIEVRRQLLTTLDQGAAGAVGAGAAQFLAQMPSPDRAPKAVQVTSEQSAEALEVFRDEAQGHLQTITAGIAQLERSPRDVNALRSVRRAMHTLKGAAGMMGFASIQTLAHASEDLLERLGEGALSLTPNVMKLILDTSEALDQLISGKVSRPEAQQKLVKGLTDRYSALTGAPAAVPAVPAAVPMALPTVTGQQLATQPPATEDAELTVRLQLSRLDDLVNLFGELLVTHATVEERISRLNALMSDAVIAGERLRDVGSQLETRFEAAALPSGRPTGNLPDLNAVPHPSANGRGGGGGRGWQPFGRGSQGGSHTRDFDELEMDRYTEFHRLSRSLAESVTDIVTLNQEMETLLRETQTTFVRENRLSSEFQDRLLKARLVPLQSLIPRLYRSVRGTSLAEGKEVEFFVEGGETEVDRKVIEEVEAPLLHLVRNAVSHGIEKPDARARAHKPRQGRVTVSAAYDGNSVVISVRDDGAGIDPDRIRATAIARGWVDRNTKLSDKDAINLIFQPGVTTAPSVTEQRGRGVGLDVVRDAVAHMRGTVTVDSQLGQGTVFTMRIPISLQIARAVLVRVGPQTVAIPMSVVDQIGRLDYYQRAPGQTAIEVRGLAYPVVQLATYLKVTPGHIDARSPVLLVNAGAQRVALLVDAIVTQQELVRKPLGAHLRDVRGVAGAAVLGNGQVVLILELQDLLSTQPLVPVPLPEPGAAVPATPISLMPTNPPAPSSQARAQPSRSHPSLAPASQPAASTPRRSGVLSMPTRIAVPAAVARSYVLVVDDSPSVRRVVSGMLKANGWNVQVARDGVEALELIAKQQPAAILLDIEMPRMDGYELMATLRSQEPYRTLPIVVLTSRAASKHQQRAMQLGADDYVVKPYQEQELLLMLARLIQARGK